MGSSFTLIGRIRLINPIASTVLSNCLSISMELLLIIIINDIESVTATGLNSYFLDSNQMDTFNWHEQN